MKKPSRAQRPVRRRRDPEQARVEILDAAERLLALRGPDVVGLKDVAAAAGVSHALVTHYFGTYGALVGAVFDRGTDRIRTLLLERLSAGPPAPEELLELLFEALSGPVHGRLAAWAAVSARGRESILVASRKHGMRQIADFLEAKMAARTKPAARGALRGDIEFALLAALSAAHGYALGGDAMHRSLGKEPTSAADAEFRRRLAALLRDYLKL
jgi:AcrR family transcriptional regulator